MAIKIGGNTVIDNSRRGTFLKANPGSYSNSNRPSASTGDIIYNSDEQALQVWTGSEWKSAGGLSPLTASGGNTVRTYTETSTGRQYKAHIFTSSGTFTVSALGDDVIGNKVEYLVVAGGGGTAKGGGGGAGGLRTNMPGTNLGNDTVFTVSATSYTVTVGAGGYQANGNDSSFGPITSEAGGMGGGNYFAQADATGSDGGSGGGGYGGQFSGTNVGGSGNTPPVTPSQGNDGAKGFLQGRGAPVGGPRTQGGGGGGASNKGIFSYRESPGGPGGDGIAVHIAGPGSYTGAGAQNPLTGTYGWFSGGGGGGGWQIPSGGANGGLGGIGGGGQGFANSAGPLPQQGTNGTANTGGGAGFETGGSGIVIIRYQIA